MFGQDLSRKKMYPTAMKVNPPGTEIVRSDLFICLETVSLSLVSAQEGCLTSLRCLPSLRLGRQLLHSVRQLPSFSTTAESETVSRQIKSVLTSVLSLGFTFLGSRNIDIFHRCILTRKWVSVRNHHCLVLFLTKSLDFFLICLQIHYKHVS